MEPSAFTKIIKGELPSSKVYEDDETIAIIPLHPIAKGHVLVIPKKQVDQIADLDDETHAALMRTVHKVERRMMNVLEPKRVGLQVVGLDVPHVHVHVIAFDTLDEYREFPDQSTEPDFVRNAELAAKLAF